jgi:transposase
VSIHDLEILAGSVRRRNFTRADKEAIVSETLNGDTTVADVARRHQIDRSLVYRWRREFGVVENAGARPRVPRVQRLLRDDRRRRLRKLRLHPELREVVIARYPVQFLPRSSDKRNGMLAAR